MKFVILCEIDELLPDSIEGKTDERERILKKTNRKLRRPEIRVISKTHMEIMLSFAKPFTSDDEIRGYEFRSIFVFEGDPPYVTKHFDVDIAGITLKVGFINWSISATGFSREKPVAEIDQLKK